METHKEETALEVAKPRQSTIERMTVNQIEDAFKEYLELQKRLDELMPDQILKIGKGKNQRSFRKKGYWRMVKKWARLSIEVLKEERIETGDDWGYLVTARVTAPDGQAEDGDGSCMASEKNVYKKDWEAWKRNGKQGSPPPVKDKDGKPVLDEVETAKNATVHNVRAHATTRAKNRAISDLVGFGEVSAEELPTNLNENESEHESTRQQKQQAPQQKADEEASPASQLWHTKAKLAGVPPEEWALWCKELEIRKDKRTQGKVKMAALELKVVEYLQAHREPGAEEPEESKKFFVDEAEIAWLKNTADVSQLDIKSEAKLLAFCREVVGAKIDRFGQLTKDDFDAVMEAINLRNGDAGEDINV